MGQAQFSIPVSGPKGSGTLCVEAKKSAGEWNYTSMVVEVEADKRRLDLLETSAPPPE